MTDKETIPFKAAGKLNMLIMHNEALAKDKSLQEKIITWALDMLEEARTDWSDLHNTVLDAVITCDRKQEAKRLAPVRISDINKHQYVSCIGAFDGPISVGATAVAGLYKEGADLYKKWNNPLYGTNWDIIQDSHKDLGNDAIGIARGWSANNINDCNYLLPAYARKR